VLIVTDFRTSTAAPDVVFSSMHGIGEIGHPLFAATQVMAHPGTNPTVSVPVCQGRSPVIEALWAYLAEAADFFGFAMPEVDRLSGAIGQFIDAVDDADMFALSVTIVEFEGAPHCVVAGSEVRFIRPAAVRIDECDAALSLTRSTDPLWRRMAARTTSRAEEDQLLRWLEGRGYVDGLSSGIPLLGALLFEHDADVCGVENSGPRSTLTQLQQCGAIGAVRRADRCPVDAERVWWVSAGFEVHPVAAIGAHTFAVSDAAPAFARIT